MTFKEIGMKLASDAKTLSVLLTAYEEDPKTGNNANLPLNIRLSMIKDAFVKVKGDLESVIECFEKELKENTEKHEWTN